MPLGWFRYAFLALLWTAVPWAHAANVAPELLATPEVSALRLEDDPTTVDLNAVFRDPDVAAPAVRINVRIASVTQPVYLALNHQQTPLTTANFLRYIREGRYVGTFFHRSVSGFVVQGGGFYWRGSTQFSSVPKYPAVLNEPGISNVRGTVAMAKQGGNPNSATSEWFVNLADNSANLDNQNGGFTVFGRVLGTGMSVIDEVANVQKWDRKSNNSAFTDIPLTNFSNTSASIPRNSTVETEVLEVHPLTFTITNSHPEVVGAAVVNSTGLQLTPKIEGTSTLTVLATDLDGATVETTFTVTVKQSRSVGWRREAATEGAPETFVLDAASTAGFPKNTSLVPLGNVPLDEEPQMLTFRLRNTRQTPLSGVTIIRSGPNAEDITVAGGPAGGVLAPGQQATFTVAYKPLAAGAREARVSIATPDTEEPAFSLKLTATAVVVPQPTFTGVVPQLILADEEGRATVPNYLNSVVFAFDEGEAEGIATFTQSPQPGSPLPVGIYPLTFAARNDRGRSARVQTSLRVYHARPDAPEVQAAAARTRALLPPTGSGVLPPGSFYSAISTPAVSDLRHLAARVTITAGGRQLGGIVREDGEGTGELVAYQTGGTGVGGLQFGSFQDPVLSSLGKVAFGARLLRVPAAEAQGLWTDLFGPLQMVLRAGAPVPGLPGVKLSSVTSISLTDEALTALVKLQPVRGVVTRNVDDVVLLRMTSPTAATVLARTGQFFDLSSVRQISVLQPAARSLGQGRWVSEAYTLARLTMADKRSLLVRIDAQGGMQRLLQAGVPDPTLPGHLASLGLPALGGTSVALLANKALTSPVTRNSDSAIYLAPNGTGYAEIVTEDSPAGVAGEARFASFSDPALNMEGKLLFYATLRGGKGKGANNPGLWWTDINFNSAVVARVGQPAVDGEGEPLVNATWATIGSFALPDGAGAGPVFIGTLAGRGVKPNQKTGIWAVCSDGKLRLLLQTGTPVPVGADATKTVASFKALNSLPGSFGTRRSYNASGNLAVQVTFTDRSQGLLRLDIP